MHGSLGDSVKVMRALVADTADFSHVFHFQNGTSMVVSRNAMIPGGKVGYVGVLPYDKAGNQIDERAENWLTAEEVTNKMEILASE